MRKIGKIEGTAFTKRKSTRDVAETPQEFLEVFWQMSEWAEDPWASHRAYVEAAREALALETERNPPKHRFKAREESGWYLQQLVMLGGLVQGHIDQGEPSWAAHEAALFGEMFSELQMKLAREELFLLGKKTLDERVAGGASTRKGSDSERLASYRRFRSEGLNKSDATDQAAQQLGVSPATIRNARKGAGASD